MYIVSFKNKKWNWLGFVLVFIYYVGRYYLVNIYDLIVKKEDKFYYKNSNNEEILFILKKINE